MEFSEKFALYRVFTSHMVLQRERPVVISGTAEPGKTVRVSFAGKTVETVAGQDREWCAKFPAMAAGGPYEMTVSGAAGVAPLHLEDILVGEVWMCAGQSNMEMPVDSANPFFRVRNPAEELKNAANPRIRFYNAMLTRRVSPEEPLKEVNGLGWQPCDAKSAADFSACGYFFGRHLEKDLDVPVGLIATAWGGTDIAAWISSRKYDEMHWPPLRDPDTGTEELIRKNWREDEAYRELADWLDRFETCGESGESVTKLEFDDSAWASCSDVVTLPRPGRYACRISFELPAGFAGKVLTLNLGSVNDSDRTWFNGEFIGSTGPETPSYWSVPRRYTVPAHCVRAGRNCVTVIADNHYGSGGINTFEIQVVSGGDALMLQAERKWKTLFVLPDGFPVRPAVPSSGGGRSPNGPNYPSTLFNAMLNPWFRYAVRGTLWYQGCHNNGEFTYYPLHKMLIDDMREHWNDPEMAFLLVQLASFIEHRPESRLPDAEVDAMPFPEFPPFALVREMQAEMPRVRERVGMAISFDVGDHSDVHPHDKQTLGYRLAMKAEAMVYGKAVPCDGPEFAGFRQEGEQLRVFFRNAGAGLTTSDGGAPMGFVLGDRTGALRKAEARIEGDTVVVSCAAIPEPQRVRYAFTGYCRVNLINKEGFPAVPFRSDKPEYEGMFKVGDA